MGFKARAVPAPAGSFFTGDTLQFLGELEHNNDRAWFADNKHRYEAFVREPALALIRALAPRVAEVSPHFVVSDSRVGGSLMRVFRDTRFSPDKTPFKTNIGIHMRHRAGKDVHAPGLYLHVALDGCFLGVGSWRPAADSLARIRARIVDDPDAWAAARDDAGFRRYFELGGESLKRPPRGFGPETPHIDDLRRKDHTAMAEMTLDDALDPGVIEFCAERFLAARPYLGFLTRAVGAPF